MHLPHHKGLQVGHVLASINLVRIYRHTYTKRIRSYPEERKCLRPASQCKPFDQPIVSPERRDGFRNDRFDPSIRLPETYL